MDAIVTKPRQSEPTLKDIAEAAGVSVAAVSKVLNNREGVGEATRARVLHLMEQLGYRGRSGRQEATGEVTLVTLEQYVANDAFYGEILSGISATGQRHGQSVNLSVFRSVPDILLPGALPLDGRPMLLMGVDHPEVIARVAASGGLAVIVNGMDRTMRISSVSPDYHFGAALATRHLLDLGHREILHVTHPYRETIRRRIDGFRNALEEFGLPFRPQDHLLDLEAPANISLAARDIVQARLAQRDRLPTAIFCMNDMVALAVIQAVQAMGLSVPEDISVMGFDGLAIGGYATPQLSSIRTDRAALGRIGVELLVQMMGDTPPPVQRVTLGAELLAKRSTTSPRG